MKYFDVIWSRYDGKFKCLVGLLEYDDNWTFTYDKEGVTVASKLGFTLFPEFPNIDTVYKSKKLFQTFDIRITNIKNVNEKDKIELLEKNNGVLVTDNISIKEKRKKYEKV